MCVGLRLVGGEGGVCIGEGGRGGVCMLGATQVCDRLPGNEGGRWRIGVVLGATLVCDRLPGGGRGREDLGDVGDVGVDDLITSVIISSIIFSILLLVSSSLFSSSSACFLQDLLHL